jgi:hypothetical protein
MLRRGGWKPAAVHVDCDAGDTFAAMFEREVRAGREFAAHVHIDPADSLGRLDLRCVVGLWALVSGSDAQRVEAVATCCKEHGAKVLASVFEKRGNEYETVALWQQ